MGTNYYLHGLDIPDPDRDEYGSERLHIGKSSAGWVFALHVIPDEGINDLPDWIELFQQPGAVIVDEYGRTVSFEEMVRKITDRSWAKPLNDPADPPHLRSFKLANVAGSLEGPNNLRRTPADGRRCVGHGEGTWDLHVGEFC